MRRWPSRGSCEGSCKGFHPVDVQKGTLQNRQRGDRWCRSMRDEQRHLYDLQAVRHIRLQTRHEAVYGKRLVDTIERLRSVEDRVTSDSGRGIEIAQKTCKSRMVTLPWPPVVQADIKRSFVKNKTLQSSFAHPPLLNTPRSYHLLLTPTCSISTSFRPA
jgi:hypothetical protein